jgi:hypothetical protein
MGFDVRATCAHLHWRWALPGRPAWHGVTGVLAVCRLLGAAHLFAWVRIVPATAVDGYAVLRGHRSGSLWLRSSGVAAQPTAGCDRFGWAVPVSAAMGCATTIHAMAACQSSRVLKARNVCTFSSSMPALQTGQTRQWLCTCIHLRTSTHDIPCTKHGRQRPVATHVMSRCIACCSAAGASRCDHVKSTVWSKTSEQHTPSLQGSEQP